MIDNNAVFRAFEKARRKQKRLIAYTLSKQQNKENYQVTIHASTSYLTTQEKGSSDISSDRLTEILVEITKHRK